MASGDGRQEYAVEFQPRALDQLERLRDRAIAARVAVSFTEDIARVVARLKTDPVGWGDALNDYKTLHMVRRRGQSTFVYVYYAFHPTLRTVYVQSLQINPYGPLAG